MPLPWSPRYGKPILLSASPAPMAIPVQGASRSQAAVSRIRQVVVVVSHTNMDAAWQLIRYRNPEIVALIGPYASSPQAAEFKQSLCEVPVWRRWETGHRNISSIYRKLRRNKLEAPGPAVEFCLNSGPFAVRLAAMQWARAVGARISLLSLPQKVVWDVDQTNPPEPIDGKLPTFLDSRGVRLGAGSALVAEQYLAAAEFLAGHLRDWREVITWLRVQRDPGPVLTGSVPLVAVGPPILDQAPLQILQRLRELHIVDRVHTNFDRLEVRFVAEAERKFVNGIWLEVFVYGRLRELFDDCRCSQTLHVDENMREVDFIGLAGGRLAIASCKTSLNPFDVEYLEELQTWSTQLGRPECARFFVTDSAGHHCTVSGRKFEAFAESKGIVVVQGDALQQVQDVVRQAMRL